jgi:ATP-dependent DNA helicase RecQ
MLPANRFSEKARSVLKQYWNYPAFRPLQEEIIVSILEGKDTLALLPTGGGKSICYQVPALCTDGLCLVISPLIALMKDQVEQLRKKNITAYSIVSGMTRKELIQTLTVAGESNCKFLYVSPERLETALFKEYLPSLGVSLIAVDEAHCISQWGYDFRPPYLRIAALREELPNVPVLALTASATPQVQEDIQLRLNFRHQAVFRQSFERPNLSYSVNRVESRINRIIEILQRVPGSSLVYCRSRKRTREISEALRQQGIVADFYHAGLSQEERAQKQESWIRNTIRTMVCTNAFGMGIDKPDVRVVIHAELPDCLENYYQEAGRAGRDGQKAYAVLLYQESEIKDLSALPDTRFPELKIIREVYQSLMNFLQLPSGSGEGQSFDFEFADFIKRFPYSPHLVMAVIKTLEQEGQLSFNEQVFTPSKVQFITDKRSLNSIEETHPELEPLTKNLLRTYEGILDQPVSIHEKSIAYALYWEADIVVKQLKKLASFGIIQYQPRKEKPQLYFLMNRVPAEQLMLDIKAYKARKEEFTRRINAFLDFVSDSSSCRSKRIGNYFGDSSMKDCGVCDNCLAKLKLSLQENEFNAIREKIRTALNQQPTIEELLPALAEWPQEKIWHVIHYLQREEIITTERNGKLRWVREQ